MEPIDHTRLTVDKLEGYNFAAANAETGVRPACYIATKEPAENMGLDNSIAGFTKEVFQSCLYLDLD